MYLQTQKGYKLINLDRYDYLGVDENQILAYQGEKYVILGEYEDFESAINELCSVMAVCSNVIKMD